MTFALHIGDCRAVLATLPAASVHCVVTSPPYWGLRDYGTATWDGGDPACKHVDPAYGKQRGNGVWFDGGRPRELGDGRPVLGPVCHCGAIRIDAQLGLEPNFNAYVASMVAVFREVRRVLRDDGTLWLNLGDSYASGGRGGGSDGSKQQTNVGSLLGAKQAPDGLKPKDLCGIPWRVAFALQADGWYLRQDIIWSKPNPMPESVTDRCTKAHEYLFLLSKRERYYYDADAIREPGVTSVEEAQSKWATRRNGMGKGQQEGVYHSYKDVKPFQNDPNPLGRNKRSVWEVTTQPFSEAHFATFPPALIEACIKAGCPSGGTVLDPFGGAGTTGLVADRLQRNAILIELNPAYAAMSSNRIKDDAPLFVEMAQP